MSFYGFAKALVYLPSKVLYPATVIGKENIPKSGGFILASNHLSMADPVQIGVSIKQQLNFLGKKELFDSKKLYKKVLTSLGGIPVDRERASMAAMKECITRLKAGKCLLIFPEGTRNLHSDEPQEFKGGVALFAAMSKCPIVPVAIYPRALKFRRNYIIFGKPIYMDEYYGKRLSDETVKRIDAEIRESIIEAFDQVPAKFREKYLKARDKIYAKIEKKLAKKQAKKLKKENKRLKKQGAVAALPEHATMRTLDMPKAESEKVAVRREDNENKD